VTALSFDEIVQGKRKGILRAATPYLAAYALPMFLLAWRGHCIDTAMIGLALGWGGILIAGYAGAGVSGTEEDMRVIYVRHHRPAALEWSGNSGRAPAAKRQSATIGVGVSNPEASRSTPLFAPFAERRLTPSPLSPTSAPEGSRATSPPFEAE